MSKKPRAPQRAEPDWDGERFEYLHLESAELAKLGEANGSKEPERETRIEAGLNVLGSRGWMLMCSHVDGWEQKFVAYRNENIEMLDGSHFDKWTFMRRLPPQGGSR